jgi:hypothetical protein
VRFLWFDWDDPETSLRRSKLVFLAGLGVTLLFYLVVRIDLPDGLHRSLLPLVAVGYTGIFIGAITTLLAYSARWHRSYRDED